MKIAVTGASGLGGRYVVNELLAHGYGVRAVTLEPWNGCPVEQAQADVTDAGQIAAALQGCDALVHLAAIPSPHGRSEQHVFQTNVMGVFNTLLAAGQQGMKRAAVASSDCAYGITYSLTETKPIYVPIDEEHPVTPDNCYGLSKVAGERVADGMAKRFGMSVASLRITFVTEPHQYAKTSFHAMAANPEEGPWNVWSFLDARDCARAFRLSLEGAFDGHEIFCIASAEQRCSVPSAELKERYYPDAEVRKPLAGRRSFLDGAKAETLLGFVPRYGWGDS